MSVVANYPKLSGDWLRHELDPRLFRKAITLVSGAGALVTGTVLGKITASGKYGVYDPTANTGLESPVAILLHFADASSADAAGVIVTGNCEIAGAYLTWGPTVNNQTKINTGLAALAALGFQNRSIA